MAQKPFNPVVGTEEEISRIALHDYQHTCHCVGHALTKWTELESQLSFLYANCMNARLMLFAIESFYSVSSFDGRINLTNTAVRLKSENNNDKMILQKWKPLNKKLRDKVKDKRNQIAHGRVAPRVAKEGDNFIYRGTFLIPYFGLFRANFGISFFEDVPFISTLSKKDRVSPEKILQWADLFVSVATEISSFTGEIRKSDDRRRMRKGKSAQDGK